MLTGIATKVQMSGSDSEGPMGVGFNRAAVSFDGSSIRGFLSNGDLKKARLVLTVAENEGGWGDAGQPVDALPLLADFVEGNGWSPDTPGLGRGGGQPKEGTRGEGPGVTWNCAVDADISNNKRDCSKDDRWKGGTYGSATAQPVLHFDNTTGEVEWDVTEDVLNGTTAWLIKRSELGHGGNVNYYSLEGALDADDPNLAPRLILER